MFCCLLSYCARNGKDLAEQHCAWEVVRRLDVFCEVASLENSAGQICFHERQTELCLAETSTADPELPSVVFLYKPHLYCVMFPLLLFSQFSYIRGAAPTLYSV